MTCWAQLSRRATLALGATCALAAPAVAADTATEGSIQTFVAQYCVACHDSATRTAGLDLVDMSAHKVFRNSERWEAVVRKLPSATNAAPGNAEAGGSGVPNRD